MGLVVKVKSDAVRKILHSNLKGMDIPDHLTCLLRNLYAGQVVWYSRLFQNCPQFIVIHTVKGFGIVNKAEIDVFLELSCFFHDPVLGVQQSNSDAFFRFFSIISYYKTLNRVPCAIQ